MIDMLSRYSESVLVYDQLIRRILRIVLPAACLLAGCTSEGDAPAPVERPGIPASIMPSVAGQKCPAVPILPSQNSDEKQLNLEVSQLKFPEGVCFFAVRVVEPAGEPGMVAVGVDLDAPNIDSPNDMRPMGSLIARMLKNSSIAPRVSALTITNWGDSPANYNEFIIDEEFEGHPWGEAISTEVEAAWWVNHG
ncbi:hypothetical protein ACFVMC_23325 [Nocardia sp. NPDC127579]|uniref:hypothetical protein n=1 Tax=Nocardia sp. NPDC127579 TaxID=3345402 RepID=UPI00362B0366